jgi:S1-C subfamily serine protease
MKKLFVIIVLGLLWCNVGFADKWTINYFKKNLDEFKERTDLVCAGEPKEKHKKLYLGGCYDHRIQLKGVEACIENWKKHCPAYEKWFKDRKAKEENVTILKVLGTEPAKKKSITLQCYYDKNNEWIDYRVEVDREFIEYHLFKYKRYPTDLEPKFERWQHNFVAGLKLIMADDTIGKSRVFPRYIEMDYSQILGQEIKNVPHFKTLNSKLDENNKIVPKSEWQVHDKTWEGNTLTITESTLSFEFKNQESYRERNSKEEIWARTTDKVIISLHSGLFNFYRFTKWKQGEDDSYVDRSECTGTQELYKYIAYIKAFIEEFEKVRAEIRKGEGTKTAETGVVSGTAFFINSRGNLLTNNHVVEGCKLQKIIYENNEHEAKIVATDKTLDLALLKTDLKSTSYISFSKEEPTKLQTIYVAGYPLGKGLSDDLKINDGKINSLKGFENNSNEIQVDAAINPGNSGGPIVNRRAELVAIAVSGMSKEVTEGINFGIKSSAAENFLKSNKITPNKSLMFSSVTIGKLVKLLEESTVYTFCE